MQRAAFGLLGAAAAATTLLSGHGAAHTRASHGNSDARRKAEKMLDGAWRIQEYSSRVRLPGGRERLVMPFAPADGNGGKTTGKLEYCATTGQMSCFVQGANRPGLQATSAKVNSLTASGELSDDERMRIAQFVHYEDEDKIKHIGERFACYAGQFDIGDVQERRGTCIAEVLHKVEFSNIFPKGATFTRIAELTADSETGEFDSMTIQTDEEFFGAQVRQLLSFSRIKRGS
jgi:hypothetical protein